MDCKCTGIDDKKIIQGINNGDNGSFSCLFHTHYSELFIFVHRYTGDTEISKDLIQDVFISIWNNHKTWTPSGSLRSYLYKAARNRALNHLRNTRVKIEYETEAHNMALSDENSPEDIIHARESANEIANAIEEAMKLLPDNRKMIFLLSREDGLTYEEIAEVMDISVKTVETQMGRSIKTLRQYLSKYLPILLML